ncbi:hypothetical protein JOL79_25490 [Microbispora sp. RL4-1S]|uniref:SCO6045-like C-terminal domain-containing protein n=1 Tax=Microbispora oryzae TaxID=2806554 RepID=A0A941AS21_9ACTN|nr:hypothetical protein [Microbispora oryzae]MBP2707144.1 hypothetical protein [Microbispora oryzae]
MPDALAGREPVTVPSQGPEAAREALAAAQRGLLAALLAGGPVPAGFDAGRIAIEARSLLAKRAGSVARVMPGLARELGAAFGRTFAAYGEGRPRPEGGSRADAEAFARWLDDRGLR